VLDLGNPNLDWCRIGEGMGVESARAETIDQFGDQVEAANRRNGPFLIERFT
jgi:acetolactate synthase-1/2/3 large subunit